MKVNEDNLDIEELESGIREEFVKDNIDVLVQNLGLNL